MSEREGGRERERGREGERERERDRAVHVFICASSSIYLCHILTQYAYTKSFLAKCQNMYVYMYHLLCI